MTELRLPRLGSTMDEGMIVAWRVAAGESFGAGDVLYEVTTDKVNMEVEADYAGTLAKILVGEGQSVRVGEPVAWVDGAEWDDNSGIEVASAEPSAVMTSSRPMSQDGAIAEAEPASGLRASPAARRRGRELGVDLQTVTGTGPKGRILQRDVESAGKSVGVKPATREFPVEENVVLEVASQARPFSGIRAVTAQRMSQSASIPQVTLSCTARLDDVDAARTRLKGNRSQASISLADFVLLAVARGLMRHPDLNGWVENNAFIPAPQVDLGYAVDAPDRGLYVVCLRSAERLTLEKMAQERRTLTDRVLEGRVRSEDLGKPSFTVTNLGPYGVEWFNALINPPQIGILAVGAVQEWGGPRRIALSLTFDHRAVDGAPAARFLQDVKAGIENLALLL